VLYGYAATMTIGLESVPGWGQVSHLPVMAASQSGELKLTALELALPELLRQMLYQAFQYGSTVVI
jgi:hypothetical protein